MAGAHERLVGRFENGLDEVSEVEPEDEFERPIPALSLDARCHCVANQVPRERIL